MRCWHLLLTPTNLPKECYPGNVRLPCIQLLRVCGRGGMEMPTSLQNTSGRHFQSCPDLRIIKVSSQSSKTP